MRLKKVLCGVLAVGFAAAFLCAGAVAIPGKLGVLCTTYKGAAVNWPANKQQISAAIVSEYKSYTSQLKNKAGGAFNVGTANAELVHPWGAGIYSQEFDNGDSTATRTEWEHTHFTVIMYSTQAGRAYTIVNDVLQVWSDWGGPQGPGAPLGEQFWDSDGNLYQNFQNQYVVCKDGNWYDGKVENGQYKPKHATATKPGTTTAQNGGGQTTTTGQGGTAGNTTTVKTSAANGNSAASTAVSASNVSNASAVSGEASSAASAASSDASAADSADSATYTVETQVNWPATIGIIAAIVVVLGGAGFCVWFFVLRKKLK